MISEWLPRLAGLAVMAGWALAATFLYLRSSKRIRQTEQRYTTLSQLSQTDPLTGLPNRTALLARSANLTPKPKSENAESAVFIDFDNFRIVNEALGHMEGDRILKELAAMLVQTLNQRGEVFRIGGDEFLIILKVQRLEELESIAHSLQRVLARQVNVNNRTFYLTTSIGIYKALPGDTLEDSLRKADIALFFAKKLRNNILVYSPRMESSRTRDTILSQDLPTALDRRQFDLTFQPVIEKPSEQLNHVDVKAVWQHPEFGLIRTSEFMPVAEFSRLIIPLQDWIIRKVCRHAAKWRKQAGIEVKVGIAISPFWFESTLGDLVKTVQQALSHSEMRPENLILKFPEITLADKPDEITLAMHRLHELGVQLYLDHYGASYTALKWLSRLPLSGIQLDPSLIQLTDEMEIDRDLLNAMVRLAKEKGLTVTVPDVNSNQQSAALGNVDCDAIMGSQCCAILSEDALLSWLKERKNSSL